MLNFIYKMAIYLNQTLFSSNNRGLKIIKLFLIFKYLYIFLISFDVRNLGANGDTDCKCNKVLFSKPYAILRDSIDGPELSKLEHAGLMDLRDANNSFLCINGAAILYKDGVLHNSKHKDLHEDKVSDVPVATGFHHITEIPGDETIKFPNGTFKVFNHFCMPINWVKSGKDGGTTLAYAVAAIFLIAPANVTRMPSRWANVTDLASTNTSHATNLTDNGLNSTINFSNATNAPNQTTANASHASKVTDDTLPNSNATVNITKNPSVGQNATNHNPVNVSLHASPNLNSTDQVLTNATDDTLKKAPNITDSANNNENATNLVAVNATDDASDKIIGNATSQVESKMRNETKNGTVINKRSPGESENTDMIDTGESLNTMNTSQIVNTTDEIVNKPSTKQAENSTNSNETLASNATVNSSETVKTKNESNLSAIQSTPSVNTSNANEHANKTAGGGNTNGTDISKNTSNATDTDKNYEHANETDDKIGADLDGNVISMEDESFLDTNETSPENVTQLSEDPPVQIMLNLKSFGYKLGKGEGTIMDVSFIAAGIGPHCIELLENLTIIIFSPAEDNNTICRWSPSAADLVDVNYKRFFHKAYHVSDYKWVDCPSPLPSNILSDCPVTDGELDEMGEGGDNDDANNNAVSSTCIHGGKYHKPFATYGNNSKLKKKKKQYEYLSLGIGGHEEAQDTSSEEVFVDPQPEMASEIYIVELGNCVTLPQFTLTRQCKWLIHAMGLKGGGGCSGNKIKCPKVSVAMELTDSSGNEDVSNDTASVNSTKEEGSVKDVSANSEQSKNKDSQDLQGPKNSTSNGTDSAGVSKADAHVTNDSANLEDSEKENESTFENATGNTTETEVDSRSPNKNDTDLETAPLDAPSGESEADGERDQRSPQTEDGVGNQEPAETSDNDDVGEQDQVAAGDGAGINPMDEVEPNDKQESPTSDGPDNMALSEGDENEPKTKDGSEEKDKPSTVSDDVEQNVSDVPDKPLPTTSENEQSPPETPDDPQETVNSTANKTESGGNGAKETEEDDDEIFGVSGTMESIPLLEWKHDVLILLGDIFTQICIPISTDSVYILMRVISNYLLNAHTPNPETGEYAHVAEKPNMWNTVIAGLHRCKDMNETIPMKWDTVKAKDFKQVPQSSAEEFPLIKRRRRKLPKKFKARKLHKRQALTSNQAAPASLQNSFDAIAKVSSFQQVMELNGEDKLVEPDTYHDDEDEVMMDQEDKLIIQRSPSMFDLNEEDETSNESFFGHIPRWERSLNKRQDVNEASENPDKGTETIEQKPEEEPKAEEQEKDKPEEAIDKPEENPEVFNDAEDKVAKVEENDSKLEDKGENPDENDHKDEDGAVENQEKVKDGDVKEKAVDNKEKVIANTERAGDKENAKSLDTKANKTKSKRKKTKKKKLDISKMALPYIQEYIPPGVPDEHVKIQNEATPAPDHEYQMHHADYMIFPAQEELRISNSSTKKQIFYYQDLAEVVYKLNPVIDAFWKVSLTAMVFCQRYQRNRGSSAFSLAYSKFDQYFLNPLKSEWKNPELLQEALLVLGEFGDKDRKKWLDTCLETAFVTAEALHYRSCRPLYLEDFDEEDSGDDEEKSSRQQKVNEFTDHPENHGDKYFTKNPKMPNATRKRAPVKTDFTKRRFKK